MKHLTNAQFDEVEEIIRKGPHGPNKCPTCSNTYEEIAPGVWDWPSSTFQQEGQKIPCNCAEQVELYRHYLLANIPEEYMRWAEGDFFGDESAWEKIREYIDKWGDYLHYGIGIGLHSKSLGTGKTFLATYIARQLVKRDVSVHFVSFLDMVAMYQLPYEVKAPKEKKLLDSTCLVLDEVREPYSDAQKNFYADKFELLIRNRNAANKVTIFTTNIEPEGMDDYYSRVYSLLCAKQIMIKIQGLDVRREGIFNVQETAALNGERRPIC